MNATQFVYTLYSSEDIQNSNFYDQTDVVLHKGSHFGMLIVKSKHCNCSHSYFFCCTVFDPLFSIMQPRTYEDSNNLQLYLPNGKLGLFRTDKTRQTNDACVLKWLSECDVDTFSLRQFFYGITRYIGLKSSYKRWKKMVHRENTKSKRMAVFCLLSRHNIDEIELRMRIVNWSGLW